MPNMIIMLTINRLIKRKQKIDISNKHIIFWILLAIFWLKLENFRRFGIFLDSFISPMSRKARNMHSRAYSVFLCSLGQLYTVFFQSNIYAAKIDRNDKKHFDIRCQNIEKRNKA